jgi:hypothetical protein
MTQILKKPLVHCFFIADIVTKPRRLLERLFDNLKYIASKKQTKLLI